jgi:hypothetical protein
MSAMFNCASTPLYNEQTLKLRSDGGDSGSKTYERGYGGVVVLAMGLAVCVWRDCQLCRVLLCASLLNQRYSNCGQHTTGGPQAVSEEKSLQKLYQTLNERKIHPYRSVLKLLLLVDLQQKVGELVLSITSCLSVIILENNLN